jgi:hypothetical protein
MPVSLVSARHDIIAWSKNADGDTAGHVAPIAILVRRSMEPTGRGAVSNIGQPIPTVGVRATTTLSEGYWVFAQLPRSSVSEAADWTNCPSSHPIPSVPDLRL